MPQELKSALLKAVGDAFTFVAPDEEGDCRRIEREVGRRLTFSLQPSAFSL